LILAGVGTEAGVFVHHAVGLFAEGLRPACIREERPLRESVQ
jgi:hypothetical protein